MKIAIYKVASDGNEKLYKDFQNAKEVKENENCIIVYTANNKLMYSKPEFKCVAAE